MNGKTVKNLGIDLSKSELKEGKFRGIPIKVYITETEDGREIIIVKYELDNGETVISNFSIKINKYSPIIKLIHAANGFVPDVLDDLEELLIGKEVMLELKESRDGMYINPVRFYPVA